MNQINIAADFALKDVLHQKEYLINGEILQWSGPIQDVYSPICIKNADSYEQVKIGSYPLMTQHEALQALNAAVAAYDNGRGKWPCMSIRERIQCVENFAFSMQKQRDRVVELLMWEIGKNRPDSEKEFDRTVEYIKDTVDALKELDRASSRFSAEQGIIAQIRRAPLGVVLCMGPFNYPLNETFTTLIPALIMGNTIIFKPPKLGVLLHEPLLEAFRDSFPAGAVNTVYGDGKEIITPLMTSGKIDVLAFIGSSRVADILKKQHPAPHRLRCVLGLDAKNPAIVLKDAQLKETVAECVTGSLSFNGQRCTALKIIFVHESIAEAFAEEFSHQADALKAGLPWESGVKITPLPEEKKTEFLQKLVDDACENGASVMNKNSGIYGNTLYFPAVLYPVNPKMRIYTEEQFGPVVPIVPYSDIEEAVSYVVNSNYGQQVSVFGTDPGILGSLIDPLVNQVCRVNINSQCQRGPDVYPFTGRKDSAEGTLSVSDALRVFSIRTLVAAKATKNNKEIITTILQKRQSNFLSTDFIL